MGGIVAFRRIVSKNANASLGGRFEKNEHERFGYDGLEPLVDKVAKFKLTRDPPKEVSGFALNTGLHRAAANCPGL